MLGQLPPRFVIWSDALPEPVADPDPVSDPEPAAIVSESEPVAEPAAEPVPEPEPVAADPVAEPVAAEPDPSVPDPPLSFLHAGAITKQSPNNAVAIRMPRMLPAFHLSSLALAAVLQLGSAHAADDKPDLKLPPGTRADASGQLVSSRNLRETTDFIAKELDRRSIVVKKVGPVRVRGVELTRFLSETASTPWLAIHVMRASGKTVIFFVARPAP